MKIILFQDVKGIGKKGELKEVKDGYGKNFLIAKGLAKPATPEHMAKYHQDQAHHAAQVQKQTTNIESHKTKIASLIMEAILKTDKNGKGVFDSVNKQSIKEFLANLGIEVAPEHILLEKPIKEIGNHVVLINLGQGIEASLKILVTNSK